MGKAVWNSTEARLRTEHLIVSVLAAANAPLTKNQVLDGMGHEGNSLELTLSHVNSVLYSLEKRRLARQVKTNDSLPCWQLVGRETGRAQVREFLRGRFAFPPGMVPNHADCPVPHKWVTDDAQPHLKCIPSRADQVADWLEEKGYLVKRLSDLSRILPTVAPAELGGFFLRLHNPTWTVYDPETLSWRPLPTVDLPQGRFHILREGWSLRQRRADTNLFFLARPTDSPTLDGEEEAICRILARTSSSTRYIPAQEVRSLVYLDISQMWLPHRLFSWLASLRPSEEYHAGRLIIQASDRVLVETALRAYGLALGPWGDPPVNGSFPVESLCNLLSRVDAHPTAPERAVRWLRENDRDAANSLQPWLSQGFLDCWKEDEHIFGIVLAEEPAWRYMHRKQQVAGHRHFLYVPSLNRVLNFMSSARKGVRGEWLRVAPTVCYPKAGLVRGRATIINSDTTVDLGPLESTFRKGCTLLNHPTPENFLGDYAPAFPHTGRPCRVVVIKGQVTASVASSLLQPAIRLRDIEGTELEVSLPWEDYLDTSSAVHDLKSGNIVQAVVRCWLDRDSRLRSKLMMICDAREG